MCACVCARACVCMCACVRVCDMAGLCHVANVSDGRCGSNPNFVLEHYKRVLRPALKIPLPALKEVPLF